MRYRLPPITVTTHPGVTMISETTRQGGAGRDTAWGVTASAARTRCAPGWYGSGIVVCWSLLATTTVPFVPTTTGTTSAPGVASAAAVPAVAFACAIGGFPVVFLCGVTGSLRSCLGCCFSGFLRFSFGVGCSELGYCIKVLGKQIADFLVRRLYCYHWCNTCCCRGSCSKRSSGSGNGVFFTLSSRRMIGNKCSHDCGNTCRW